MNYKVIKKIGDRTVAKYYDNKTVAQKKAEYKGWTLLQHKGDMEYSSRSLNSGSVKQPKYEIEIIDIGVKFGLPTEGIANQVVEQLSEVYKDIRCRYVAKPEESSAEVEDMESEI